MAARMRFDVPSDSGEQRDCARGQFCAASTRDVEGAWHPAKSYAPFCAADQSMITASADALPAAYERLGGQIGQPARRGTAVRVPPGSRVLLNGDVDALIRMMAPILAAWAARVRGVPGLRLSRHGFAPGTLQAVSADCGVLAVHTVPMLALPEGPMSRTWTWRAGSPMPEALEDGLADLEIIHVGDGWVRVMDSFGGVTAGHDVLDLHRATVRLLGETPAPPVLLDGIPCRNCEAMSALAVLEQPPPDPGEPAPPFCRCQECRDEMTAAEYREWTRQYAAWVGGSGVLTCRRCCLGNCPECSWLACSCRHEGHGRAAA